jgi:hypothetical protein
MAEIEARLDPPPLRPRSSSHDLDGVSLPLSFPTASLIDPAGPSVEVSIGTVEIIAEAPPPLTPAPEARGGFDEYSALRNYEDWD